MNSSANKQKYPIIAVDIIVEDKNRILLGKFTEKWTDKGKYSYGLPGSEIQFGETIGNTVKRTILEQLGCEVLEYKIIGVNANYAYNSHYVSVAIVAKIQGEPRVVSSDDWQSWEWFEATSLPEKLFDSAKYAIESYRTKTFTVSE